MSWIWQENETRIKIREKREDLAGVCHVQETVEMNIIVVGRLGG